MKVLSLFTGGGGLDIGFKEAGFDIVACLEIDKPSCGTLQMNKGHYVGDQCQIFNNDITKTAPESLSLDSIDFIIGGPPCQSFSAAGRRAGGVYGINDTRGSLFWYYCKFLEHFQPKGFLFENVKGILQANKSDDWNTIKKSFEQVGYRLKYMVLDAADYGVAQHRERVIMVGIREDLEADFAFPLPTHGPDSLDRKDYVTAGQALDDLDDPNEIVPPYTGKYGHLIPDIPPGMNYSFYTEKMGHPSPRFAWRSKFSGFLYKLSPDQLSKTIVANQGKYDGPFHWKNRKLHVCELKRLQGFPDDYKMIDSKAEATKQIGNSVSPKMAKQLGLAVKKQLFGEDSNVDLMPEGFSLSHGARKAMKSKKTRKLTTQNTVSDQLSLIGKKHYNKSMIFEDVIRYKDNIQFKISGNLNAGDWVIHVNEQGSHQPKIEYQLNLMFTELAGCEFKQIDATISTSDIFKLDILWDSIHEAVNLSSSYENLQPLYGHFTEPYPKFRLRLSVKKLQQLTEHEQFIVDFFEKMVGFHFLSKEQALSAINPDKEIARLLSRQLREHNFDVRTHETNRAIKEGYFKACYPFSLSSKSHSYVTWIEKGRHKTADILTA